MDLDPTARKENERGLTWLARVWVADGELRRWNRTAATLQMLPVTAVWTTRCRQTQGSRGWCPFPRLRPDGEWKIDWRWFSASGASSNGDDVALGLPKPSQTDEKERAEEGEGTGPERG
jgi:hypothetical protein